MCPISVKRWKPVWIHTCSIESKHHLLTLVKRESICFSLQQAEVNATAHVTQRNTIKFLGRIVSGHEKFKTL